MEHPNPIVLDLVRGSEVEAWHRGAWCAWRGDELISRAGDVERPVYLRSGAKPLQALVCVLSGAPDRFGLEDRHLALACASHGGEPAHVAAAEEMLTAGGLTVEDLDCGVHRPLHLPSGADLKNRNEAPTPLHNNCSGKHAAMLLAALARGEPTAGYLSPDHPVQRAIKDLMVQFGEVAPQDVRTYVDGCSAPTFVMPLSAAARALRNHAAPPRRFGAAIAEAAARLHRAMAREPFMVGGTRRLCTDLPVATRGRVFGKVGAEGFYGVFSPIAAFGLAVHVDDGSQTAAERIVVDLLRHLGMLTDEEAVALGSVADPIRRNHRGIEVGRYMFHPDPGGHSQ